MVNVPSDDGDLQFDGLLDDWSEQLDYAEAIPVVNVEDAHGRPYPTRRRIEEWLENRSLRQMDDLDAILATLPAANASAASRHETLR